MKLKLFVSLCLTALALMSCENSLLTTPGEPGVNNEPTLVFDEVKGLVVFTDENNVNYDIVSLDEDSGQMAKCISPEDFVVIHIGEASELENSVLLKAVVIGVREDGNPGVWLVFNDGSVKSPVNEKTGKRTSLLSILTGTGELLQNEEIKGFLGWSYFPKVISEDGLIIGGYAVNEKGFPSKIFSIEPGKKAAVYWTLKKGKTGCYSINIPYVAGIIGEPEVKNDHYVNFWYPLLSKLKLLLLDYLENYLVEVDRIEYSENTSMYLLYGSDKDGIPSVAEVDLNDIYSITALQSDNQPPAAMFYQYDYLISGSNNTAVNGVYILDASVPAYRGPGYVNENNVYIFRFVDGAYYWGISDNTNISSRSNAYYYQEYQYSDLKMGPEENGWLFGSGTGNIVVATGSAIIGSIDSGRIVRGNYQFSDPDGDSEGNSVYQWYLCDTNNASDEGVAIVGGNSLEYIIPQGNIETINGSVDKSGKYLKFEITPVDEFGNSGTPIKSEASYLAFSDGI